MLRYASIFLLLLLCLTALPQPDGRNNPVVLERFHDDALNITYFYPSRFARLPFPPATALTSDTRKCVCSPPYSPTPSPRSTPPRSPSPLSTTRARSSCASPPNLALSSARGSRASSNSAANRASSKNLPATQSMATQPPSP